MKTNNVLTSCLLLSVSCCLGFASCQSGKTESAAVADTSHVRTVPTASTDTNLLRVAVVPDYDCLPVYYAQRSGIYRRLGLQVHLASYASQMDCDTALLGQTVDGGIADSVRWAAWGKRASSFRTMWKGNRRWQFVVRAGLRGKEIRTLRGRTLATARQATEDHLLTDFLKQGGVEREAVYRPQINDLRLRAAMLADKQYDGAFLSWPYVALARQRGVRIWKGALPASAPTLFVMKRSRLESPRVKKQWELFEQGRRMAMDSLRIKGPAAYTVLLQQTYRLPAEVADTLRYQ